MDQKSPINFIALSTQTEGYSAADLKDLVARAIHQVAMKASNPGVQVSYFIEGRMAAKKLEIMQVCSDAI